MAIGLSDRRALRDLDWGLVLSVLVTFLRSPLQFFVPPSVDSAVKVHGPVSVRPGARN